MKKADKVKLGRIQNLIGRAKGAYQNDRDPNRAESVVNPLEEAFQLCIEILGQYPPVQP